MKKLFSVVIPIYGNELNLPITIPYIMDNYKTLFPNHDFELILVNDGSPDNSWEIMKQYQQQYPGIIRLVNFVRNFGQSSAIHCGVTMAQGDAVGVISADLQDPFELFAEMLKAWEAGSDLVCGIRSGRDEHGLGVFFSKMTHHMIHRFVNPQYPQGGFDFFLMDRSVAQRFTRIQEKNGSLQLLVLWASHNASFIPYTRMKRRQGKSGWTTSKKIKYFLDTFVTNSYLPLRVMSVGGILLAALSFLYMITIMVQTLLLGSSVQGWSSLAVLVTFFSGLILLSLGVIGEYLWRIYDAVKGRPMYTVLQTKGMGEQKDEDE